ncbi:MAG TPA: hypothetical protein VGO00_25620, partial [Kofleriaceae bacterium]|nr:hypothetical protein [Kofleriaceae bacterium]
MRITIAIALTACGGAARAPKAVAPTVARAASPAPPPAPVVAQEKPPAACTDGGDFSGAWIGATGVRYCIDTDCWTLDPTSQSLTPTTQAAATTKLADDIAVVPFDYEHPQATTSPWTVKLDNDKLEVCGPDGCSPFPLAHTK